jgi:chaperonin GroEL
MAKEQHDFKFKQLRDKTDVDILIDNDMITKDYSNTILSNVVDETWTKRKVRSVMAIIAKTLAATLGPDGSTTILERSDHNHLVTKDGLDIIDCINFRDDVSETVLDIVREISQDQVLAVGDGSTSAIIVANAIYQELTDPLNTEKFKDVSPQVVIDLLSKLADWIEVEIKKIAKPVSPDMHEIDNIAAISMNNNDKVGHMIADIYRKIGADGIVTPDASLTCDDDYVEYKNGIDWGRGYIDPIYPTQLKALNNKIVHDKPYIFICNDMLQFDRDSEIISTLLENIFLNKKDQFGGPILNTSNSLVIISNKYDQGMRNMLKTNRAQKFRSADGYPYMDYTVVDIANVDQSDADRLVDMGLLCGCKIYNPEEDTPEQVKANIIAQFQGSDDIVKGLDHKFVGRALKTTITDNSTSLICDGSLLTEKDIANKEEEIKQINLAIDDINSKSAKTASEKNDLALFKHRLANLSLSSAIYHVGGKTIHEQESRERLVEDAIFASRSALKYGYTIGGNLLVPRILTRQRDEAIKVLMDDFPYLECDKEFYGFFVDLIRDSFLQSYYLVLANSQYLSESRIEGILNECVNLDRFYDLKKHKMENDEDSHVINSAQTESQIAKSCIGLMSLLAKSNQIITINIDSTDHFFSTVNKLNEKLREG